MPSHSREASRDRELVLRHQSVPMWDSSDPERAPPPLPMNPGGSPATKANVSPNIQAVAAQFAEKARENVPSPYTTNPMPPKSPEKSLIKGQFHKRMQSLQNTDTRSEFFNYLENKSPERPIRATVVDPGSKPQEKGQAKAGHDSSSTPDIKESEREVGSILISNRYLSKPILGESSTPPSATMLALQNMQLPIENETQSRSNLDPFTGPSHANPSGFESLSTQIGSLTDIASNLQREMAQLSRRSKDNATDLVSLKAATNARDEDIRKSLRDLSSNLTTRFLEGDGSTRWDFSAILGSEPGINPRESDSSPTSKRSYSAPRLPSPNPFAMMDREVCGSPAPISDGSASIALLEKVLREMGTKEGQEKLIELVDEIKSRPMSDASDKTFDATITKMLEEILNIVKEDFGSKALIRSRNVTASNLDQPRPKSLDPTQAMDMTDSTQGPVAERADLQVDKAATEEMLSILRRVKSSVIEGGGITNEVKALVRELRGEVLGMGRNIARKLEEADGSRAVEDGRPLAPGADEISAIVNDSLHQLRQQLASMVNESRHHSSALSEFRHAVDGDQIYSIVKSALDELELPQPQVEPTGVGMQKEEILETVREAWETYKPEIELQNFGLERDEILECLSEGLKAYQPQHEQAVTYDQVLTAVQAGVQNFEQPPSITKDEIIQTIRECFEQAGPPAPRGLEDVHLGAIRREVLQAVTESVMSQSVLTRDSLDSGLGRDEILSAVNDGLDAHFSAAKTMEKPHITKDDVTSAINDAFEVQNSAITPNVQPTISREEVLSAIVEGLESQNSITREIELNKDDLMDAISSSLHEVANSANFNVGEQVLERLEDMLERVKDEFKDRSSASGRDTEHLLDTVKDGFDVVRKEIEGYVATSIEASGKHEIMDTVKEGFRLLQADMEKTITDTAMTNGKGNPDTPELLDAMEKEFEHLRQTLSTLLLRNSVSNEKDEIIDAIREISDNHRSTADNGDVVEQIRKEFDNLRETMTTSLVRAEPTSEKDEIIAALQERLDVFREETAQPTDSGESVVAATSELLDAFHDGVGTIRGDLSKLLEKPVELDPSELLDTLKEGLNSLKADVEAIRKAQQDADEKETTRGGEVMLANEQPNMGDEFETLKMLISELQDKVDAIATSPRAPEPSEDALKKEHLDEVLLGLHELQSSVTGIVARENPVDEIAARKEDTDAIETLLRNTKAQIDELVFPSADEIAKAEQLGSLESVIMETKEAITGLSTRLAEEGPTKSEIGTLESLVKDVWIALDELKSKGSESTEEEADKLSKSDLQTVEAMVFEVKSQIDELKLPDVETLPTKTDIQELSALVAEFREKVEAENEMTAQGFDARKTEHAGLAEKIEEAKAVVEGLGDEMKGKLDGTSEGLSELRDVLAGLAASSESFMTVENVKELTELINREFERSRGEQEAGKLEDEERDAASSVKQDEARAAIIVELGAKIDEKLAEVVAKYDEAQTAVHSKFSETEERDNANLEAITNTKSIAEDIQLVIGAMGNSVNETCERMSVDTKTFFAKVDVSYNKMEEMQNEVKTHQEQARVDLERAAATTDRLESKLHEFHPQVLESIQEILAIVSQHYDHSQKSTEDIKMDLSTLPSTIPSLLPALPPPESEKYDDARVHEKLNTILEHSKNEQVKEALDVLVERVTNDQVHEKLQQLLNQTTSTNSQVYDKLSELLDHATNTNGPVHEKLDTLIGHATNTDQSVTQMMKLDEMHQDIMETSRKMNEMFAAQSAIVAEDNERKRGEAEEAAIALERRTAQKEQVEAEIVDLKEEKESLLNVISTLKSEREGLVKQNTKLGKELSGLEMALDLRHEEMQLMEERADGLEKRILEGVLDHARSVLLSRPTGSVQGLNMKKRRSPRARGPSAASNASTAKEIDNNSILGSGVGLALKKRSVTPSHPPSTVQANTGKERRILSLSHVTGNRGAGDRQGSVTSGFTNLKRSHSVKSNISQRKASWGGRSSVANKENDAFPEEEEENQSGGEESDASTTRRTSYTGTCTDSMIYGTESVVSDDRRVSAASSINGPSTLSVVDSQDDEEERETERGRSDGSDVEDHAETTKGEDDDQQEYVDEVDEEDAESKKMVVYGQPADSGLGSEIAV